MFGNGPNATSGLAKLFVLFLDKGIDGWDDGDFVKMIPVLAFPCRRTALTGFPNALGTPALSTPIWMARWTSCTPETVGQPVPVRSA